MSAETRRLFFLGAGASVADGVPLTSKLILGVAASLADPAHHSVKGPFRGIPELLERLYGVSRRDLKAASGFWPKGGTGTPPPLPTITEVLSLIDCLLAEDGVAGSYPAGASWRGARSTRGSSTACARESCAPSRSR